MVFNKEMKKIWITWEKHRRTSELISALPGVKLFQLEMESPTLIRYPCLLYKTIVIVLRERPELVIVQNPSIALTFFMVTFGKLLVRHIVVDAHNAGLSPLYSDSKLLMPLYRLLQKRADLTIVTNKELSIDVGNNGGLPFIIEDRIPVFDEGNRVALKGKCNVVFVCTFEKDEPYREVIRAANLVDRSICIYITGKYEKVSSKIIDFSPSNVIFTGYLPDRDYLNLLTSCDLIIDLTLLEGCLVCGAYEATAIGKPVILSDTSALRNYFGEGAVFTENKAAAIARAINYALQHKEKLEKDILLLRSRLQAEWEEKLDKLISQLDEITGRKN